MKQALLILLTLAIIASCKTPKDTVADAARPPMITERVPPDIPIAVQEQIPPPGELEELIIGDWEWEKTICCGRTPFTETPETLGASKMLRFQQDGELQHFTGGELTFTQTYKITYGLMDDQRPVITIGTGYPALLFIYNDTLFLNYEYMDLQKEYYVRRK